VNTAATTEPQAPQPIDGPEATGSAATELEATDLETAESWRRLSLRVVYLDLARVALSLVTGYIGIVIGDDVVWPLVGGAGVGLLGALADLIRWRTTRYRITSRQVEMHSGWLSRKQRIVARDRIRTVDSSAKLLPRLLGLRTVHIGSGESGSSFKLEGLDHRHAEGVRQELMPGRAARLEAPATDEPTSEQPATSEPAPEQPATAEPSIGPRATAVPSGGQPAIQYPTVAEAAPGHSAAGQSAVGQSAAGEPLAIVPREPATTVIATLRRHWVPLNVVTVWAVLTVAGPLFGLHWFLRPFGVDLWGLARDVVGWETRTITWNVVVLLLIGYPLGVAGAAVAFMVENWNFELVRTGTAPDTALVTRRGLLSTRTVQRSDERMRGIAFEEPLVWRWLRLTKIKVLTAGQRESGGGGDDILPRVRMGEARELARHILPEGSRPLETGLRRHPRGALLRRLGMAVYEPAVLAGLLVLFCLTGALPDWVWPLPLLLIPLTVPLAVVAYRSLGHAIAGVYVVVRRGAFSRHTVALQRRAVIGWTVEQSILQRWGGRMTVGVATAAGNRHYNSPDMSTEQALEFIEEATPRLAAAVLERS
jgi:putative membrane protein